MENFFSGEIANKVPQMFLILASLYAAFLIPALFMVKDVEKVVEKVVDNDQYRIKIEAKPELDNYKGEEEIKVLK